MKKITNIDLMSIKSYKFPITAISSILHRITGLVLLLATPFAVVMLYKALGGPVGYKNVCNLLIHTPVSFFFWFFLSSVTYHILAGFRHIAMDMGFGENMATAKSTSIAVLILGIILAIFWGGFLWL